MTTRAAPTVFGVCALRIDSGWMVVGLIYQREHCTYRVNGLNFFPVIGRVGCCCHQPVGWVDVPCCFAQLVRIPVRKIFVKLFFAYAHKTCTSATYCCVWQLQYYTRYRTGPARCSLSGPRKSKPKTVVVSWTYTEFWSLLTKHCPFISSRFAVLILFLNFESVGWVGRRG